MAGEHGPDVIYLNTDSTRVESQFGFIHKSRRGKKSKRECAKISRVISTELWVIFTS